MIPHKGDAVALTGPVRVPTPDEMAAAQVAVSKHLRPTPLAVTALADRAWLKLETMQPTGSFKVRGAIAALSAQTGTSPVFTASAGNHGLGMSFAAATLRRQITVVVPANASSAKVAALKAKPIDLIQHGSGCHDAEIFARSLAEPAGRYVSPYNDAHVIAGQATLGAELDAQLPGEDITVVCGVGGGGLCAGLSLWAATRRHATRAIGVESAVSRAVSNAISQNRVVDVEVGETIADGLAGQIDDPGVTWQIIRDHAHGMVAVDDDEIGYAMRWLFREHGQVVEGAGAAGVAAVLAGKVDVVGTLVVVLTGRNVTASCYARAIQSECRGMGGG